MMHPPLNISKITPPQISHILLRSRLMERLKQNQDKKLFLFLGQAAQGKSTLALSYAHHSRVPAAWVKLGPEDGDAVNLFYLLVQSLQRALPDLDFSPVLVYPSISLGPREEGPLHREWALSLVQMISTPVDVIFDGLDRLPDQASAFRYLQVLLEVAPSYLHLLMLSREMPPFEGEILKDRRQVLILNNEELAFTLPETTEYFTGIRRFFLAPELIKRIHHLTEGWIGGLVLLCDSLDWVPESQRAKYISQEMAGKFIGGFFQFFGEKIFASLPGRIQEFLIRSSILDVLEPDFIRDSMGIPDAQAILEDLARRNLFVQRLYDKKGGWSFRYHQLFRDFLQAKFQALVGKEQQQSSYFRAGSLSEERGELEVAVRYFLRGRAYPEAASAIEKIGLELVRMGKTAELSQWLNLLPADLVQENPWLLFYHYMTGRFTGSQEYLVSLQKARALFEQQGDLRGSLLSLAYLIEAAIYRGSPSLLLSSLVAEGEALLQSKSSEPWSFERAVLWFQIGFNYFFRGGNPRKGFWACRNAHLLARDLGDIPLQITALIYAHANLSTLGEFAEAQEICKQVDKLLVKYSFPELRALHLILSGQLSIFRGDLEKARTLIHQGREETEKSGLTYLYPVALLYEVVLKAHLEEYSEAEEIGKALLNLTSAIGNLFLQGAVSLFLGLNCHFKGDLARAKEWLGRAQAVLSSDEARSEFHLAMVKIIAALVALKEEGSLKEAEMELQEALDYSWIISSHLMAFEARVAMALLKQKQNLPEAAANHIKAGFKVARHLGSWQGLFLSRRDLVKVCALALELEVPEAEDYAVQLLSTRLVPWAGPELERLSAHPHPKVAGKAWEVRRSIHRTALPRLTIRTLGGFRLWRGESPLEEKDLEGHQPKLLLKAIIARGGSGVPKDLLIEDLWPESAPEVTEKNFKVNLHRLRKALEPALDKTFGSSYVHLKANLISLDPELCQVDVEAFLSRVKDGVKKEEQGDVPAAISLYRQALDLYGGDFLAEELYLPWADMKREELQGRFIELLYRMSGVYEKRGTLTKAIDCYRKVIQADPLSETAGQKLMLLYAQRGMRSAALRVYEDLKKVLKDDLGAEPDPVTTAIYQRIL